MNQEEGAVGTSLLIDNVGGQLTFIVSTGNDGDIDISSAIDINTDYVYIVEITGAADDSVINLRIAEGTSFSSLDGVAIISDTITSSTDDLAGSDGPGYLSSDSDVQYRSNAGDFQGTASEILFFSDQSIPNRLPIANAGLDQNVSAGTSVTLDGSGSSDADGQSLDYTWSLLSGSGVTIADPSASSFTFTLPSTVVDTEILTFGLIVNDGRDDSVRDEVVVSNFNTDLLSGLTLTEQITSTNVVNLNDAGYNRASIIFAGKFNTDSMSSQFIYESGGDGTGIALRIDDIAGQLTFVVSTGRDNNIDISGSISINTDYVYIVEIAGATDNSEINLYIAEGTSFSVLDSTTSISGNINAEGIYSGIEAASYLSGGASVQGNGGAGGTLGTAGNFSGTASEILLFSGQSIIANRVPVADAGTAQTVSSGETVTLDGSGSSDADGDTLMYAWTQTEGTNVTLSDATASMPTFTAPTVSAGSPASVLTFQLIVSDSFGSFRSC